MITKKVPSLATLTALFRNERVQGVVMAVLAAAVIGSGYLYWSASERESPDFDYMAHAIQQANRTAQALRDSPRLLDVNQQWYKAVLFAKGYDVTLDPLEDGSAYSVADSVTGGGFVWQGVLSGEPDAVLMAAIELQKRMPIALGQLAMGDGRAALVVGIIGSPPVKMNTGN